MNFSRGLALIFAFFVFVGQAQSTEKSDQDILIKGDEKALEVSDLPLSQYQYDDLSFFTQHFNPKKELLKMLENPDVILNLDPKTVALDFDDNDSAHEE
jgi:hypothetical protein